VWDAKAGGEGGDVQDGPFGREGPRQHGGRQARIMEGWRRDEDRLDPSRPQGAGASQHPEMSVSRSRKDDADA
jgi:hypothetical protein